MRNHYVRRDWLRLQLGMGLAAVAAGGFTGCNDPTELQKPQGIFGKRGLSDGKFHKPRAIAVNGRGEIFVVDMTARIQVFDSAGNFLRGWSTPTSEQGRPTGLSIDRQGRLMVADTHYFRVLFYSPEGELDESATIGGTHGTAPGEFGFVTDVIEDKEGNFYVSEYGVSDRIQKFSPQGDFICQWGGHGEGPGFFQRPQSMGIDSQGHIWVSDACNHRLQVFASQGDKVELVTIYGGQGKEIGKFQYPYGLVIDGQDGVWISEFGGHRIQKLDREGKPILSWGQPGRLPGELFNPWAVSILPDGQLLVVDSGNHRVQRVRL